MAQLCCKCLNVTVNVTGEYKTQTRQTSSLFSQSSSHPLLTSNRFLYEVQLGVAGIVVCVSSLVVSTAIEDWVLTTCANCRMLVYITHSYKMDRTFVTQDLLASVEDVKKVTEQSNFSSIFQISLHSHEEADSFRRKRVASMSFGREDPEMKRIHQQMKDYLTQEEEAMEERIRLYEKQQRQSFQALQEKAHQERRTLFAAITRVRENMGSDVKRSPATSSSVLSKKAKDQLTTSVVTATPSTGSGVNRETSSAQRTRHDERLLEQRMGKATVTITLRDDVPLPTSQVGGNEQSREEMEGVFSLDGFDVDESSVGETDGGLTERLLAVDNVAAGDVAFPQSDDEEISTDDSSFRDLSSVSGLNYGTSVPLDIPMYSKPPPASGAQPSSFGMVARQREESRGDMELEWGELGNCIRQLALSVQDTGMFGDLPRPRMHEK